MTDSYFDALTEISIAYLHEWIDAPYKHNFAQNSEEWLRQRGFYQTTCLIPYPMHVRWREMMGMPPNIKVYRDFDRNGKMIEHV
jgi:hypothetical protein